MQKKLQKFQICRSQKLEVATERESKNVISNFDLGKFPWDSFKLTETAITCVFFVSFQMKKGMFFYFLSSSLPLLLISLMFMRTTSTGIALFIKVSWNKEIYASI